MSIFDGDGRKAIQPTFNLPGLYSRPVRRSTARLIVEGFKRSGVSNHSGMGSTVWVVLQHLQETRQCYEILSYPGFGIRVRRLSDPALG